MKETPSHHESPRSRGKIRIFRLAAVALGCLIGLGAAELVLRSRDGRIRKSDQWDPGLAMYDPELSWTLTPNWSGRHRNCDFDVRYAINSRGFRQDHVLREPKAVKRVAVVGDSFTFGLGVKDDETFVHLLNDRFQGSMEFINCAVPGYSTDQEALLIERKVLSYEPEVVLLVVYLGNDLLDNLYGFPIQVNVAKPYFVLEPDGLRLMNTPVPQTRKSVVDERLDLTTAVLGEGYQQSTLLRRWGQQSALIRLVSENLIAEPDHQREFEKRFTPAVALFSKIIDRIAESCQRQKARFTLVLLGGRSFVEEPNSISAQYQEYFRQSILTDAGRKRIPAIDLSGLIRERYRTSSEKLYHPNDGHLNALGHRMAGEILSSEILSPNVDLGLP